MCSNGFGWPKGNAGSYFKCRWHLRRVPFDQKFRFQFPKFSYVEWNGIFHQAWPISFYSRLAHFPSRITQENAEGSWWSSCLKCRIKLLHVEKFNTHSEFNSSLIVMRETYELFSPENMQTGRTDRQEIRNRQSIIFQEIRRFRFRSRIGSNYGRSFCIQCSVDSKDAPPSCSFSRLKELGPIQTG